MINSHSQFFDTFKNDFKQFIQFLPTFLKNPIQSISYLPDVSWASLIVLNGAVAAVCGILSAFFSQSLSSFIGGLIIAPFSAIILTLIVSGFFYYTFLFFFQKFVSFKTIFAIMVFATIPLLVALIIEPVLPPIALVGMAVTGLLLIVGFVDTFHLPRRGITRLIVALYVVYVGLWIAQQIDLKTEKSKFEKKATPESLDILEKELKNQEK